MSVPSFHTLKLYLTLIITKFKSDFTNSNVETYMMIGIVRVRGLVNMLPMLASAILQCQKRGNKKEANQVIIFEMARTAAFINILTFSKLLILTWIDSK